MGEEILYYGPESGDHSSYAVRLSDGLEFDNLLPMAHRVLEIMADKLVDYAELATNGDLDGLDRLRKDAKTYYSRFVHRYVSLSGLEDFFLYSARIAIDKFLIQQCPDMERVRAFASKHDTSVSPIIFNGFTIDEIVENRDSPDSILIAFLYGQRADAFEPLLDSVIVNAFYLPELRSDGDLLRFDEVDLMVKTGDGESLVGVFGYSGKAVPLQSKGIYDFAKQLQIDTEMSLSLAMRDFDGHEYYMLRI